MGIFWCRQGLAVGPADTGYRWARGRYSIVFPHDEPLAGRNARVSALHSVLAAKNCVYQSRHGFERPEWANIYVITEWANIYVIMERANIYVIIERANIYVIIERANIYVITEWLTYMSL